MLNFSFGFVGPDLPAGEAPCAPHGTQKGANDLGVVEAEDDLPLVIETICTS